MRKLFLNIDQLLQVEAADSSKRKVAGSEMSQLPAIENAYLLVEDDKIAAFGKMSDLPDGLETTADLERIDCSGRLLLPTWCDPHTHIVFAATREQEFVMRIQGRSYEEIAASGGGILNSARKLRNTPEEALYAGAYERLMEVVQMGTGAIEIKSGYGLSFDSELKMLRVIRSLKENTPVPIKANFLGAHAIPLSYKAKRGEYIKLLTDELLPAIAKEDLADYIDVFCDEGFFTVEETDELLKAGAKYGLRGKIHANELAVSGGVQVGVANNALSVDHLERTTQAEIDCLRDSDTMPTFLPGTSYFLGIPYGNARKFIDEGLAIALASDYNPGSTPSGNMPFVLSLACTQMKLLPEEAVNACTINSAYAMGVESDLGTIKVGKLANLQLTKAIGGIARLPYSYGSRLIDRVWIKGQEL